MKITLNKQEKNDLFFILNEFIKTHLEYDLYKSEIKIAQRIIKKIK